MGAAGLAGAAGGYGVYRARKKKISSRKNSPKTYHPAKMPKRPMPVWAHATIGLPLAPAGVITGYLIGKHRHEKYQNRLRVYQRAQKGRKR